MIGTDVAPHRYTDSETGFVYLRNRYYDPATAQFINRDPITAITQEPYGYVGGNPLNTTDPLGLLSLDDALEFVERKANFVGNAADILALVAAPIPVVGQAASPMLFSFGPLCGLRFG